MSDVNCGLFGTMGFSLAIKKFPSQLQERFIVRLPDGMRDRLADAAKASGRSMNSEIVARLEASIAANSETKGTLDDLWQMMVEVQKRISQLEGALLPDGAPPWKHQA